MTKEKIDTLLIAIMAVALVACGGGDGDGDDDGDTTTDGPGPDGTDGTDVPPDYPDPDVIPDVPCYCGNAIPEPDCPESEECDDGNYENGDDCLANCRLPTCGDGFHRSLPADPSDAEECDDGADGDPDDGCTDDCTYTCHADTDCDDGNLCTADSCDTMLFHTCLNLPGSGGEVCGTGDMCTGLGTCIDGTCVFSSPLDCDDDQPCTTDTCSPTEGCIHTGLAPGTSCDDGLFCTTGDMCWGEGFCLGDSGHPCNDGDPCTVDECDETTDSCSHTAVTFRSATCGGTERGNSMYMPNDYHNYTCPDGSHVADGADYVYEVAVTGTGTLTVTVDTTSSHPATEVYILSTACDVSTCMDHGTTASASVTAGTYYIVVEGDTGGGSFRFSTSCP